MTEPISPNIKRFLTDEALPTGKGSHVLALGEGHGTISQKQYLTKHINELISEHNVGVLGEELAPFMTVFMWAYRDGKLKPPEGVTDRAYLQAMLKAYLEPPYAKAAESSVDLTTTAVDVGIEVIGCDAGISLEQHEAKYSSEIAECRKKRSEDEDTRRNWFELNYVDKRRNHVASSNAYAFMLCEVQDLLKDNPEYKTRLKNIEAVIEAQHEWNRTHLLNKIDTDSVSAAILKSVIPDDKNGLVIYGLSHLMGIEQRDISTRGTFAQALERLGLKTTTALSGNSNELRSVLGDINCTIMEQLQKQKHPFHLPGLLVTDSDQVIDPQSTKLESVEEDSLEAFLLRMREDYPKSLANKSFPTQQNRQIVEKSCRILQDESFVTALEKVRADYVGNEPKTQI
ncbi:MAG: hypothetical protein ACOYJ2_00990 [Rickettsiales bacterium]